MTTSDSTFKKLARGAGTSFVGKIGSTGLKYFTQVGFAWLLGAELFGLYTLGITVYQLVELVARMGLDSGVVRYIAIYYGAQDASRLKGTIMQAMGLSFLGGLIAGIILYASSGLISRTVFQEQDLIWVFRIFAIALPFGASLTVGAFATTGFQVTRYKVYSWELLQPLINLIGAVVLCSIGFGVQGAAIAWLLSVVVALVATGFFIQILFPDLFQKKVQPVFEVRKLLAFSLPLSFGSLAWLVLLWTDVLMLGYFRSASEVGIYRAASQTSLLLNLVSGSLITMFCPVIAKLYSEGAFEEMRKVFQTSARWSFSLTLPLFLVIAVAGENLLRVFGSEFAIGWIPLVILGIGQLFRAGAGGLAVQMLAMTGHQYLKLLADLSLAVINIALNFLLIPRWGVMGAAVATGISIAVVNLLRAFLVKKVLRADIQVLDQSYIKSLVAALLAAGSGFAVQKALAPVHFLLSLSVTAAVLLLVYGLLLVALGLEESDRAMVSKIRKRLGVNKG